MTLPDGVRIRRGRGKWVLREIAATMLPWSIVERSMVGFGVGGPAEPTSPGGRGRSA